MALDIRTLLVLLVVSTVLMALTLWLGAQQARGRGLARWNQGLALIAVGWLLVALRESIDSPSLTVVLANVLLFSGLCSVAAGLAEFDGARVRNRVLFAAAAVFFALLLPVRAQPSARAVLVTPAYAALFFACAVLALPSGWRAALPRRIMAVAFLLGAAAIIARALVIAARPSEYPHPLAESLLETVVFVVLFVQTIAASVAFLLMQRGQAEARLRRLAAFDALTGLFNRRAFLELAQAEYARAHRARSPFAILMMDLDHFKRVNDRLGHQTGDRVLTGFALAARRCLRQVDLLCRYGGEEFCALLPGSGATQALAVAERIRAAVAAHVSAGPAEPVTVSIGATAYAGSGEDSIESLIGRADEALYQAKRTGRDRVVVLPPQSPSPPDEESP